MKSVRGPRCRGCAAGAGGATDLPAGVAQANADAAVSSSQRMRAAIEVRMAGLRSVVRIVVALVTAGDRRVATGIDELFQLFADLEERQSLGGHRHGLPGARIPSGVRLVRPHREAAVAADL